MDAKDPNDAARGFHVRHRWNPSKGTVLHSQRILHTFAAARNSLVANRRDIASSVKFQTNSGSFDGRMCLTKNRSIPHGTRLPEQSHPTKAIADRSTQRTRKERHRAIATVDQGSIAQHRFRWSGDPWNWEPPPHCAGPVPWPCAGPERTL